MPATLPRRRAKGLLAESLADETVVYDVARHKAHCLSPLATRIWSRCDGETTIEATAEALREELGIPADERLVHSALGELERLGLLEVDAPDSAVADSRLTRRELAGVLARYGVATALVATIGSPTVAAAASCLAAGKVCIRKGVIMGSCCPPSQCVRTQGNRVYCA